MEDKLKFNPDYSVADVLKEAITDNYNLETNNEALQAENKRLREALKFIANEDICNAHDMIQIAKTTLR